MGRGKKKDKKGASNPEESQAEASTSHATLEEDEGGLGITGGRNKKGKIKPEDLPVQTLSISEEPSATLQPSSTPQPSSTSQPAPIEEEGGLGLSGRSRKQKKKKSDTLEEAGTPPGPPPEPEAVPPPEPAQPKQDDDDEGGLGLGGARKKRTRKKKDASAAATTTDTTKPQPEVAKPQPTQQRPSYGAGDDFGPSLPSRPAQPEPTSSRPGPPGFEHSRDPPLGREQERPRGREPEQWRSSAFSSSQQAPEQRPYSSTPSTSSADSRAKGDRASARSDSSRSEAPSKSSTEVCKFKIPSKISKPSPYVQAGTAKVLTNYLRMSIKPLKIYRYDVTFKPERPKKMLPTAYNLAKKKLFPKISLIAFDQMKNAYSLEPLPNVTQTDRKGVDIEIQDNNGKNITFEVSFKHTGIVDLQTIINYMKGGTSLSPPTEAIQCIDVILRQGTLESYVKAGRQYFKRPNRPINLGHGLEMWTGLFQSAVFTTQPFINIDVAHKGFPIAQSLLDTLQREFDLDPNVPIERQRNRNVDHFKHFLKGLKVMAAIGGDSTSKGQRREFIVNDLVDAPSRLKFTINEGSDKACVMTVADYFQREKRIRLRYPNLNCLWVGPRDKKIYYPMELLEVSYGQALNRQLNEFQLATMVREAATKPDERKRKIEEVIVHMNYSQNNYFKEFGLRIDNSFYPVQAKVLRAPKLDVGGGVVEPRNGVWQANRLLNAKSLDSWGFIALDLDIRGSNADQIMNMMVNVGGRMGMRISMPPKQNVFFNVSVEQLYRVFSECVSKGIKFVIIVVSGRGKDYYHIVKKSAEREVGILTQCIKELTANKRMNEQTIRNILLKVNSKLMGVNQALEHNSTPRCLLNAPCMVVGADVTHPSPDQSTVPSIAAVTASMDPHCFRYNIELCVQAPKMEVIVEFEEMILEHLRVFKQLNRTLPKKIFVFRDGVSEGQFAIVMNSELQAVHNAYARMAGPNVRPEVLFLLVQKRHHTRFFIPNSSYNVEPGTVVDKDIVHARELDFYLVSHQAIKGTARPTRYHAVCNDGNIPDDEVEQLTYYLCHLYSRCTRAVSYPTPTYYAHLACLRARSLTHGEKFNNQDLEKKPQRLRVMEKILEISRMFFV